MNGTRDPLATPTGSTLNLRTTSKSRLMEADGWDLHVAGTYAGIDAGNSGEWPEPAGGSVPDPAEPISRNPVPEGALLELLREEVRKRHYNGRTEDA